MARERVPLLILGGSDREPARLPPKGRGKRPLTGCKAVDVRIGGRLLIQLVIDRYQASGRFDPIYIAGPADAYARAEVRVPIIDTDGGFGRNIQVGVEAMVEKHPGVALAASSCDILPEPAEIDTLLDHYLAHAPADLWFPIIRAPEDPVELGASAWKPQYFVIPDGQDRAVRVLPGHLTVFDPRALRLRFLYRLVNLGYISRNRPILYRRAFMLRHIISTILAQEVRHIMQLRPPTFTWDVVRYGTVTARKLKDGVVTQGELENALRRIFTKRRHRKQYPERRIQTPVIEALSFARDIDTQEEAEAIGGSLLEEGRATR